MRKKHNLYFKDVSHLDIIDVYRVLILFGVTDPAIAHAAKKLLCSGIRGSKCQTTDIQEAIDTLERWKEIKQEDDILKLVKKDEIESEIIFP